MPYAYENVRQDRQSLQSDPVGYKDDLDLYTYVGNDPLNRTDPTGAETWNLGLAADITPGVGLGAELGLSASFPTKDDPFAEWDFGLRGAIAGELGLDAGAGIAFSRDRGSVEDQGSIVHEEIFSFGPISVGATQDLARSHDEFEHPNNGTNPAASAQVYTQHVTGEERMRVRLRPRLEFGYHGGIRATATLSPGSIARFWRDFQRHADEERRRREQRERQRSTYPGY